MRAISKEGLLSLREDLEEQLSQVKKQRAGTPGVYDVPTARNSRSETRESLLTKQSGVESKLRQTKLLLAWLEALSEVEAHPRVAKVQLVDLWMVVKANMKHALMSSRGWRVDVTLTDGSYHQVSIGDDMVTHEDVSECIMTALEDMP